MLVYDITDEDSFQKVKVWVKELRRMVGTDICLVIAANKADLERWIACFSLSLEYLISLALVSKRTVDQEMAERFAASVGAGHVHTSAKRNEGIDDLFVSLTSTIIKRNAKQEAAVPRSDL